MRLARRLVILTPMMIALIVAGGVTAALAFFVLPSDSRRSTPEPQGTTISAPTVAETVEPAEEATEEVPPPATLVPEEDEEVAQLPEETSLENVEESTPTPRVIRRPTGTASAEVVATAPEAPTREPTAVATRDDQLLPNPPPVATATST